MPLFMGDPPSSPAGVQRNYCSSCGKYQAQSQLQRCSACKEVYYCHREHQKEHWKNHKKVCKYVSDHPEVVCIIIEPGEGSGLANHMENHCFATKQEGLNFIAQKFSNHASQPLRSPFSELLGWNMEIYCDLRYNHILESHSEDMPFELMGRDQTSETINAAGIFLGCNPQTGFTRFNNIRGEIFVMGRRKADGATLVADTVWGLVNFVWDLMDIYPEEEDAFPEIQNRMSQYRRQTWVPAGGLGGANIYAATVEQCTL